MPRTERSQNKVLNHQAKSSYRPARERDKQMQDFKLNGAHAVDLSAFEPLLSLSFDRDGFVESSENHAASRGLERASDHCGNFFTDLGLTIFHYDHRAVI